MTQWAVIAAGGGMGTLLRYAMQGWVQRLFGSSFPVGTLAINVLGCLLIGFLAALSAGPTLIREEHRLGLMVGMLGGFTTFSAFGLETFALVSAGQLRLALANVFLSCGLGLVGVWLGHRLAERWF